MEGGEADMAFLGTWMGIAFGGESPICAGWPEAKYGKDLVQSLVYCAAVCVVVPKADNRGDVIWFGEAGEGYL
jgi:hypothetical protein